MYFSNIQKNALSILHKREALEIDSVGNTELKEPWKYSRHKNQGLSSSKTSKFEDAQLLMKGMRRTSLQF